MPSRTQAVTVVAGGKNPGNARQRWYWDAWNVPTRSPYRERERPLRLVGLALDTQKFLYNLVFVAEKLHIG
jgi:hypothetical protein